MKHASPSALQELNGLLQQVRSLPGLVEKKPGIFYARSSAYMHFHEDKAGLFADVKLSGKEFVRFPVNTPEQQATFLLQVRASRAPGG